MQDVTSLSRRQSLALIVKLMILVAVLTFVWVLLASLGVSVSSSDNQKNKTADYFVRVDVSQIGVEQLHKTTLRHREVWIYHRSKIDIEQLKQETNDLRSVEDEYFVFFPYEARRNCQLNWEQGDKTFYDPCYAQHFDLAGRPVSSDKQSDVVSLRIPEYQFSGIGQLLIDVRK